MERSPGAAIRQGLRGGDHVADERRSLGSAAFQYTADSGGSDSPRRRWMHDYLLVPLIDRE